MPDYTSMAQASLPFLGVFLFGLMCGIIIPYYYAAERLRGAGRRILGKATPYQPPPGKSEEQAMIDATTKSRASEQPDASGEDGESADAKPEDDS
jgi:hypothetical protein